MSQIIDEKLNPINNRLEKIETDISSIKEDIEELKENTEIIRFATNTLVAWAERASVEVKIPLFDKAQ